MRTARLGIVAVATAIVFGVAAPAFASVAPSTVYVPGCWDQGGSTTVPARSHVIIDTGWITKRKAQIHDYLDALRLRVTVDGIRVRGVRAYWGPIVRSDDYDGWAVYWDYDTGKIARGEFRIVRMRLRLTIEVRDGFGYSYGPDTWTYTCSIRGK